MTVALDARCSHNATSDFTVGELSRCVLLASGVTDNSHCGDNDGGGRSTSNTCQSVHPVISRLLCVLFPQ